MKGKFEIYIRHNSNGAQLHIHVPEDRKKEFLDSIKSGQCDLSEADANFEMSILQEWLDSPEDNPDHVRAKLSGISVSYFQDDEDSP